MWSSGESAAHLIVVATPAQELEKSSLGVWAEVISARGIRARIGNPTISHLLEEPGQMAAYKDSWNPRGSGRFCPPCLRAKSRSAEATTPAPTIYLGPTASPPSCCLTRLSSILRVLAASPSRQ